VVFKNGIPQGFNKLILLGGHIAPISTIGAKEEWKKTSSKGHDFRDSKQNHTITKS
jgi:hypothetical protein